MLTRRNVDHYAQASRVGRDVAERNVVLTYVLKVFSDENEDRPLLEQLAFKGGTCLRKIYFGKATRFSIDLDFTAVEIKLEDLKNRLRKLLHNKEHYGIRFSVKDEFSRENALTSYGATINYSHEWSTSDFEINISFREKPCLPVRKLVLADEMYFRYCEFKPFEVMSMHKEELIAEKIRATFQRLRSRDLYDLYIYGNTPYNKEIVRALAVIKCWNVRESFDPDGLMNKIRNEAYQWSDLKILVRPDHLPTENDIINTVTSKYAYLKDIDEKLKLIKNDSKSHKHHELVNSLVRQLNTAC